MSEATERMIEKLKEVKDPEIDTVSIVDLGMIQSIRVVEKSVSVELLPTFLGCPALPIIKKNIEQTLLHLDDVRSVEVLFVHSPPWTSDRISKAGREGLKKIWYRPATSLFSGRWFVASGLPILSIDICNARKFVWSNCLSKYFIL